jgi:hypothetical protein
VLKIIIPEAGPGCGGIAAIKAAIWLFLFIFAQL